MDPEIGNVEAATAETEQETAADVAKAPEVGGDDLKALLESARKEAVKERKSRQALEARLAEIERAQLSEAERAKAEAADAAKRAEEAERELRTLKVRSTIVERASAKGFIDPDAAFRLLDVEFDLEGDLRAQADEALDRLAGERKYLVSQPAAPTTSPVNGQTRSGTKLTLEDLKKMSQAEVDALPEDVIAAALRE